MKSLRYILGGRPHTLDDCLALACKHPPRKVTVDLSVDELVSDVGVMWQFIGTYRWEFAECDIVCSEPYGGASLPVTAEQQTACLAAADTSLEHRLDKMRNQGIEVVGALRRFGQLESFCRRQ